MFLTENIQNIIILHYLNIYFNFLNIILKINSLAMNDWLKNQVYIVLLIKIIWNKNLLV